MSNFLKLLTEVSLEPFRKTKLGIIDTIIGELSLIVKRNLKRNITTILANGEKNRVTIAQHVSSYLTFFKGIKTPMIGSLTTRLETAREIFFSTIKVKRQILSSIGTYISKSLQKRTTNTTKLIYLSMMSTLPRLANSREKLSFRKVVLKGKNNMIMRTLETRTVFSYI